jgi:hypothetical protein
MTEHDAEELTPTWYRPQPFSPAQVYGPETIVDIQRTLSVPETGEMDLRTISHIRGLQHLFGIDATGIINLETAIQIERLRNRYVGGN